MALPNRHDFGASLREARERAGVTLRDIAARSKISVLMLEALERNDLSRLPGGVFTRAFVRSYAREVGLDPDETLKGFLEQFPVAAADAELREPKFEGFEGEPRVGGAGMLRVAAWLVPILAGVVYFAVLRPALDRPGGTSTTPSATQPAPPVPAPPAQRFEPAATPGPEDAPNRTLPGAAMDDTSSATQVPQGATLPEATGGEPTPAPAATSIPEGALRVTLAATGPCWVSVTAGGRVVFSGLMQAGERREVDAHGDVAVKAGDAGALALAINGEAARPLGPSGKVATVRFTLETYRELLEAR